jgi:flagellar biosynthesis/type III secretory pathway protein FliH
VTWRPQLNVVCGRCGKPRTLLGHVCISTRNRKATLKPEVTFGACPRCKKPQGNPLTHTCHPRSDFKRRKAAYAKQQRAAARKKRAKQAHDYQACTNRDCPRPVCVAFKTGYQIGSADGYQQGWQQGYDRGYADGMAACPLAHK